MSWQAEMLEQLEKAKLPTMESVAPMRRIPRVSFGVIDVEWVLKDDDLIYHLYLPEGCTWPDEEAMRAYIGAAFEDALGPVPNVVAGYAEEVDSWAIKLPGWGRRKGAALEMATADVGRALADQMEAA